MRRAQSVRHYARPSIAIASDDLGLLREGSESDEDVLRKQLIEKDRECDKLNTLVHTLQAQLAQRPPLEEIQEMQKEYKNLELLLQGTQRENERCMAELERVKQREKLLERKLCDVAGENWQSSLDVPPAQGTTLALGPRIAGHQRAHSLSSSPLTTLSGLYQQQRQTSPSRRKHSQSEDSSSSPNASQNAPRRQRQQQQKEDQDHEDDLNVEEDLERERRREQEAEAAAAKQQALFQTIEQMKLMVLGMEQRLATREEKLGKTIANAERQSERFDVLRRDVGEVVVD